MKSRLLIFAAIFLMEVNQTLCFVAKSTKNIHSYAKTTGSPAQTLSDINNITSWVRDDGFFDWVVQGSWNGTYPKGTIGAIFSEGIVWGGFVSDGQTPTLRVGGSTYRTGLVSGKILVDNSGNVIGREDPNAADVRIYRVRPDWQTADLRDDAANYFLKSIDLVTAADIQALRDQYQSDWNSWPATKGAPFDDKNSNGIYDPNVDVPGIPGADQTIWFVANDLGPNATVYGAPSIGLEMQMTLWAYNRPGALNNIIFKRTRLIYKGTVTTPTNARIDTMYIVQWADPDLGDYSDDFVGCDTTLSLGFVYNSSVQDLFYRDRVGIAPPSVGYDFFQGPIIPGAPTDTAIFDFKRVPGFKNLPMTTFTYFASGSTRSDPVLGQYSGTLQWYNLMRGCEPRPEYPSCVPFQNRLGQVTHFELSGDPVAGTGDLDGRVLSPSDRRLVLSTGPFTMVRGDTQEIVVALVGGLGISNLNGISILKANDRIAQSVYNGLFHNIPPFLSLSTNFVSMDSTHIQVVADARGINANSITATLKKYNDSTFASITLFDDGAHGDGGAGDQIYANTFSVSPQSEGMFLNLDVNYNNGTRLLWEHMADEIPTAGPVYVSAFSVASDNLNSDGNVNPGENIRFVVTIRNSSSINLSNLLLSTQPNPEKKKIGIAILDSSSSVSLNYDPNNPLSYFTFNVPSAYSDSIYNVVVFVTDASYNRWIDTLTFRIQPFARPVYGSPLTHTAGKSDWTLSILVVDQSAIKNHTYEIVGVDSIGTAKTRGFTLQDLNVGATLLSNHPLPDDYGHNIPVTDGFKVMRGSFLVGLRRDSTRWISLNPAWFLGYLFTIDPHSAFFGGVTTGYQLGRFYLGHVASNFDTAKSFPVEVRFDLTSPQKAYRLRRTGPTAGYLIQSTNPFVNVPFSVWDVSDPANPRQLTVAWRDQDDSGDWNPPVGDDGLEIVFIYNKTYDPSGSTPFTMPPNAVEDEPTKGAKADIVYGLSLQVINGHTLNESAGTLYLRPWFALTSNDRFTFNPTVVSVREEATPAAFTLDQNYPNPFNPNTVIRYQLPVQSKVVLKIYNVLGQEVKTLVDEIQNTGYKSMEWNSTNNAGYSIASGVYFYRIEAVGISNPNKSFIQVKKMMLIR